MRRSVLLLAAIAATVLAAAAAAQARTGVVPPSARPAPLPGPWREVARGPAGGAVWTGVIPNAYVPGERASAIYLPPGFSTSRRYPVFYLLHGLPGSPASYYDGLKLADVLDGLITAHSTVPMIVVMPAGANSQTAEWAGAWDAYVASGVVPWTDAHLPTIASAAGRVLGGLCAGGYGAMDIGLRHPGVFGGLESWEGYFSPVFRDGPFVHASRSLLAANDPTQLVQAQARALRRDHVRFYVSVGGNHAQILRAWSLEFASLLDGLHLSSTLWQLPAADTGHFWRSTLPSALTFASTTFSRAGA